MQGKSETTSSYVTAPSGPTVTSQPPTAPESFQEARPCDDEPANDSFWLVPGAKCSGAVAPARRPRSPAPQQPRSPLGSPAKRLSATGEWPRAVRVTQKLGASDEEGDATTPLKAGSRPLQEPITTPMKRSNGGKDGKGGSDAPAVV